MKLFKRTPRETPRTQVNVSLVDVPSMRVPIKVEVCHVIERKPAPVPKNFMVVWSTDMGQQLRVPGNIDWNYRTQTFYPPKAWNEDDPFTHYWIEWGHG